MEDYIVIFFPSWCVLYVSVPGISDLDEPRDDVFLVISLRVSQLEDRPAFQALADELQCVSEHGCGERGRLVVVVQGHGSSTADHDRLVRPASRVLFEARRRELEASRPRQQDDGRVRRAVEAGCARCVQQQQ